MSQSDIITWYSQSGKIVRFDLSGLAVERTVTPPTADGALAVGSGGGGGIVGEATVTQ